MTDWNQHAQSAWTPPAQSPPAAPSPRRFGPRLAAAVIISLIIGIGIGYEAGHSSSNHRTGSTAAAATSPASTDAAPSVAPVSAPPSEVDVPSTTPTLRPNDFVIKVRIKSKQCFGSAGCNITFQIHPTYNGAVDLSSGSWEVTYVVKGGEDGPQINTFTITDGQATYEDTELTSTSSSATKLTAKATSVEVSG